MFEMVHEFVAMLHLFCFRFPCFCVSSTVILHTLSKMATPSRKSATKKAKKSSKGNRSAKAGLTFPVGRISSLIKKGRYAKRVSASAGVYATAVVDYLTSELLEVAVKYVAANKKSNSRITPRALTLAVRHDKDLGALLKNVTLSKGGVVPQAIASKKDGAKKKSGKKSKKSKKN